MSGRTSKGFWGSKKSSRLFSKWLFFIVKVTGIIGLVAKLGDIGPCSLCPASKLTYNSWWAHEIEIFKHFGVRSGRTSEGFWETEMSCRV